MNNKKYDIRYLSNCKLSFLVKNKIITQEIFDEITELLRIIVIDEIFDNKDKYKHLDLNDLNIFELKESIEYNKLDIEKIILELKNMDHKSIYGFKQIKYYKFDKDNNI